MICLLINIFTPNDPGRSLKTPAQGNSFGEPTVGTKITSKEVNTNFNCSSWHTCKGIVKMECREKGTMVELEKGAVRDGRNRGGLPRWRSMTTAIYYKVYFPSMCSIIYRELSKNL